MHIIQGPFTTSDHIPILCTFSVNSIQIPSLPQPSFKQANWNCFTEEVKKKYSDHSISDNPSLENINTHTLMLVDNTTLNAIQNIPYITHIITAHKKLRHDSTVLMAQCQAVNNETRTHGPTLHLYWAQRHEQLNRLLRDTSVRH